MTNTMNTQNFCQKLRNGFVNVRRDIHKLYWETIGNEPWPNGCPNIRTFIRGLYNRPLLYSDANTYTELLRKWFNRNLPRVKIEKGKLVCHNTNTWLEFSVRDFVAGIIPKVQVARKKPYYYHSADPHTEIEIGWFFAANLDEAITKLVYDICMCELQVEGWVWLNLYFGYRQDKHEGRRSDLLQLRCL